MSQSQRGGGDEPNGVRRTPDAVISDRWTTGRRLTGLIATIACVALMGACGDNDSGMSPSSDKTEASAIPTGAGASAFLRRARHDCDVFYDAAYALPPPIGIAQLRKYPVKQQRLRQRRLASLRTLTPPPSSASAYERYLSDMTRQNALYASAIALIPRAETAPSETERSVGRSFVEQHLREASRLESSLESEARALGLTKCAQDPYSATHYATSRGGAGQ